MKWKARQREIEALRKKHAGVKWRAPMPDLSVEQRTAPCGNRFGKTTGKKELPPDAKIFPVGHSHKQGLQLITPGTHLPDMGGRKS